jgi:hypothetical protein
MKPNTHSLSSARQFGGKPEDYEDIHNFLDSTKMIMPDNRHRALLHSSWGIFIAERVFGQTFVNSDGKTINTRSIAEQHIYEDFGGKFIPTVQDYLQELEHKDWMSAVPNMYPPSLQKLIRTSKRKSIISFKDN